MQTEAIREVIAKAIAHEELTGSTARLLSEVAKAQGVEPTAEEVASTLAFIKEYIEHVPDLLEACDAAAAATGISDYVTPILKAAEQYFITPLDVIFDHLGLIGLTDDAYFAQRLLQVVSDTYRRWTGSPLLPMDLTAANKLIRALIGEPQASQLDQAVAETLKHGSLQRAFQGMKGLSITLPLADPPWEDANIDRMLKTPPEGWSVLTPLPGRASGLASALPEALIDMEAEPAPSRDPEEDNLLAGYQVMLDLYNEKVKAGELTSDHQQALEPVLAELEEVADLSPDDTANRLARVAKLRDLLGQMKVAIAKPFGRELLQTGSRAHRVDSLLQGIKRYLFIEAGRPNKGEREREKAEELFVRCTRLGEAVRSAGANDATTVTLERSSLRELALEVREYARRRHLTLADPLWRTTPVALEPSAIFLSGGPQVWDALVQVCSKRGLKLMTGATGRDHAQSRWDQLRKSNLAVVDLTGAEGPDPAACYELGIALALGKSVLPVASWELPLPFELDIVPLRLENGADAIGRLGDAIDEALYHHQWAGVRSSIAKTVDCAGERLGSSGSSSALKKALERLDQAREDPIRVGELLEEALAAAGPGAPWLLRPAWPGDYPEPAAKSCLHLVPDDLERAHQVVDLVAAACREACWEHTSGGVVGESRIVRHLWDKIRSSSHLILDLTGLDPRIVLELGMAHTLGRRSLLVGQGDAAQQLFPSLAHLPFHSYNLAEGGEALHAAVVQFLE